MTGPVLKYTVNRISNGRSLLPYQHSSASEYTENKRGGWLVVYCTRHRYRVPCTRVLGFVASSGTGAPRTIAM